MDRQPDGGLSFNRQLAIKILESLEQTTELEDEAWYEAEDTVTDILDKEYPEGSSDGTESTQTKEV